MRIKQRLWNAARGWSTSGDCPLKDIAQVVFVFGETRLLRDQALRGDIASAYPGAQLVGCSTAGEIYAGRVFDDALTVTAVHFEHTAIQTVSLHFTDTGQSRAIGEALANSLDKNRLRHVFVLSDGLRVNGSELTQGLAGSLPAGVSVTGGLAGDSTHFAQTLVLSRNTPMAGTATVLGLYSDRLTVGYGSKGGWDPFGPERLVTKSKGNVLYELDGQCALDLYKSYLGKHAEGLPATGLLFPLSLRPKGREQEGLVRTILSVDEDAKTMTFAGDIPEGVYARLMKANMDRLVDGAHGAAALCLETGGPSPDLAVLISCVGRKLVLKQRVEEEVEAVQEVFGDRAVLTGFYSYGEIAPQQHSGVSELHNQTMTITTFTER